MNYFSIFFLRMAFLNQATTLIRLKEALLGQIVFFFLQLSSEGRFVIN